MRLYNKLNPYRKSAVIALERKGRVSGVYRDASHFLSAGSSSRVVVNLSKLERLSKKESVFLVPGKVLGNGSISKAVVVGAFSFSSSARRKIIERGGQALSIIEFVSRYPDGKGVRIVR